MGSDGEMILSTFPCGDCVCMQGDGKQGATDHALTFHSYNRKDIRANTVFFLGALCLNGVGAGPVPAGHHHT